MQRRYWRNRVYGPDGTVRQAAIDAEQFSLALFICSYIFQGLALVDLARLKWKDMVCIEIPDKEKYDRDRTTYGLRYAEVHKATATFYEINLVRAKTQHPTRVLVERSVAWPYMVPFLGRERRGATISSFRSTSTKTLCISSSGSPMRTT